MKVILTENKRDRLALNWLNKGFGNLTKVVRGDKTFYIDENRFPLFFYYRIEKNGLVYVNHDRIWAFFESIFGMEYQQIQDILKIWLEETYNLRGLTPRKDLFDRTSWLEAPII